LGDLPLSAEFMYVTGEETLFIFVCFGALVGFEVLDGGREDTAFPVHNHSFHVELVVLGHVLLRHHLGQEGAAPCLIAGHTVRFLDGALEVLCDADATRRETTVGTSDLFPLGAIEVFGANTATKKIRHPTSFVFSLLYYHIILLYYI